MHLGLVESMLPCALRCTHVLAHTVLPAGDAPPAETTHRTPRPAIRSKLKPSRLRARSDVRGSDLRPCPSKLPEPRRPACPLDRELEAAVCCASMTHPPASNRNIHCMSHTLSSRHGPADHARQDLPSSCAFSYVAHHAQGQAHDTPPAQAAGPVPACLWHSCVPCNFYVECLTGGCTGRYPAHAGISSITSRICPGPPLRVLLPKCPSGPQAKPPAAPGTSAIAIASYFAAGRKIPRRRHGYAAATDAARIRRPCSQPERGTWPSAARRHRGCTTSGPPKGSDSSAHERSCGCRPTRLESLSLCGARLKLDTAEGARYFSRTSRRPPAGSKSRPAGPRQRPGPR
ncbi:hypothetical protein BV25DRAFT_111890 [Artomyces pyxidatus]|uniref:Uncharacterized protein n=1 Tax=Artomyces pyxidatus TaxID=48021 RepID=A0ACB8TL98_9AGAM|nr:hypothetical protein BV25DRAFT_111890 [Artomyces pyxidatus]